MADYPVTRFETNDALTRKKWAKDLFKILLPAVEFNELIGSGSDAIVQQRDELGKGEGDQITFGIRLPLVGEGRVGREEVEGHEENLRFKDFNMTIEELNHAVGTGGRMDEQRIPYDLMAEAKSALQDWWADKLSNYLLNVLCGNSNYRIAGKVFAQAITEPDVNHYCAINQADDTVVATADAAITSADTIDLNFLDRLKQKAEMFDNVNGNFKLRKSGGGKGYYRVILHNYVFDYLRRNTNIGQWGDLLRAANKLQIPNVEIEYNGMLISKSERVPLASSVSNAYRCVLLGAQAACLAWGGAGESKGTIMSFHPYTADADRFVNIRGGAIFGIKKTGFYSKDYGIITGVTYGAPLT